MILVVGRPGLDEQDRLDGPAGQISVAIASQGARVELVGAVGDDADGERVALALGQAGVGHAALLRDPAGVTPRAGGPGGPLPRLDEADVSLGLSYLVECRVLIIAEALPDEVMRTAVEAAGYHGAPLIAIVEPGASSPPGLPESATVLTRPAEGEAAFTGLVARYAAGLANGLVAHDAWSAAVRASGWEPAAEDDTDAE
jgi:sugar/nucleoside kinase (ribokinase family)